jgi:hypothetical protein
MACNKQAGHRQSPPSCAMGMTLGSLAHQQLSSPSLIPQRKVSPQRWHCLACAMGGKDSKRFHTAFFS